MKFNNFFKNKSCTNLNVLQIICVELRNGRLSVANITQLHTLTLDNFHYMLFSMQLPKIYRQKTSRYFEMLYFVKRISRY